MSRDVTLARPIALAGAGENCLDWSLILNSIETGEALEESRVNVTCCNRALQAPRVIRTANEG